MDFGFGQRRMQGGEAQKSNPLKEALEAIPQTEIPQETTKVITVKYVAKSSCGCGGGDEEVTFVVEVPTNDSHNTGDFVSEDWLDDNSDRIISSY